MKTIFVGVALAAVLAGCATPAEHRAQAASASSYALCSKLANGVLAPNEVREIWAFELQHRGENCSQYAAAIDSANAANLRAMQLANQLSQPKSTAPAPAVSRGFLLRSYVSGMNRICIYNNLGSEVAMTVRSVDICPLSY